MNWTLWSRWIVSRFSTPRDTAITFVGGAVCLIALAILGHMGVFELIATTLIEKVAKPILNLVVVLGIVYLMGRFLWNSATSSGKGGKRK